MYNIRFRLRNQMKSKICYNYLLMTTDTCQKMSELKFVQVRRSHLSMVAPMSHHGRTARRAVVIYSLAHAYRTRHDARSYWPVVNKSSSQNVN